MTIKALKALVRRYKFPTGIIAVGPNLVENKDIYQIEIIHQKVGNTCPCANYFIDQSELFRLTEGTVETVFAEMVHDLRMAANKMTRDLASEAEKMTSH